MGNTSSEPETDMIIETEEASPDDINIRELNLCRDLKLHIDTIIPLKSNSASATDTYVLNLKKLKFNDKPVHQGFIKMFIKSPYRSELEYEMDIYRKITNRIVDLKINPGFSYVYHEARDCTYDNMMDLLKGQTFINKGIPVKIPDAELHNQFQRNMWYIDDDNVDTDTIKNKWGELRPALYAAAPRGVFRLNYPLTNYRFSFVFMESHSNKKTLEEFMDSELKSESLDEANIRKLGLDTETIKYLGADMTKVEYLEKEGFQWNNIFRLKILQIFFLICTALYAFSLSGCVHNDLHNGNIYIETLQRPEQSIFCINNKYYSITSLYKVYIYDFDNSYAKQLSDNKKLDDYMCGALQCNEWYDNLDIVKILCYMVKNYDLGTVRRSLADELIECIVPTHETEIRDMINDSYTKGDFLVQDKHTLEIKKRDDKLKKEEADDKELFLNKYRIIKNRCFFENIGRDKIDFFNRCYRMPAIIDNLYNKFFSSSRPVKVKNVNAFNLYVCHADYFTSEGMIKNERFVLEQHEKIRNSLLGINTKARKRGLTQREEEKSGEVEEKSGEVEEQRRPAKRSRPNNVDGRRSRPRRSPLRQKDGRKKVRKSPKK